MDLKSHCLFCLEKFSKYTAASNPSAEGGAGNLKLTFQIICNFLHIKFRSDRKSVSVNESEPCENFLCMNCFEMADTVRKLKEELEGIQDKINTTVERIQEVIVKNEALDKQRRNKFKEAANNENENTKYKGAGRRRKDTCLEFVNVFQNLVRAVVNSSANSDARKTRSSATKTIGWIKNEIKNPPGSSDLKQQESSMDMDIGTTGTQCSVVIKSEPPEPVDDTEELDGFSDLGNSNESLQDVDVKFPETDCENGKRKTSESENQDDRDDGSDEDWIPDNVVIKKVQRKKLPTISRKRIRKAHRSSDHFSHSTKRSNSKTQGYTCRTCDTSFANVTLYYDHRNTCEPQFECNVCGKKFRKLTTYTAHQQIHSKSNSSDIPQKMYKKIKGKRKALRQCELCDFESDKAYLLMEHSLSHELVDSPPLSSVSAEHSCDMCDKQFIHKVNLNLHKYCIHSSRQILRCDVCGDANSKSKETLIDHLKTHTDTVHSCKSCSVSCSTLDKLLRHMARHASSKRLYCPACPSVFEFKNELYKHCKAVHAELKETYRCQFCDKSYIMLSTLHHHLVLNHNYYTTTTRPTKVAPPKDLICKFCLKGKVYKNKVTLETHIRVHHGDGKDLLQCDQCDRMFLHKSTLQLHVQHKHQGVRFQCPHCIKSYSDQRTLDFHIRLHTNENLETCSVCSKKFSRVQELKIHMDTHEADTPESRRVCESCGKEFKNERMLYRHMHVHQDKKFECEYCQKMFRRMDQLKGHLRTHTGERPFICEICNKTFNRRDILRTHMSVHGINITAKTQRLHAAKMIKY